MLIWLYNTFQFVSDFLFYMVTYKRYADFFAHPFIQQQQRVFQWYFVTVVAVYPYDFITFLQAGYQRRRLTCNAFYKISAIAASIRRRCAGASDP